MASKGVDLDLVEGQPYSRVFRIVSGTNVWPTPADFEARMQVRAREDSSSAMLYDATPKLAKSVDGTDLLVTLNLTGADTREAKAGYYDIFASDPGVIDERALRLSYGRVNKDKAVTTGG